MTKKEAKTLAIRYAPVFAQKISEEWIVADQIAPVDFGGSILAVADNPKKLTKHPSPEKFGEVTDDNIIKPKIYYSVCETSTHIFIIYAVYHILDWYRRFEAKNLYDLIRDKLDEHQHDMEGALFVITKSFLDGAERVVDAVITVSHNNFYLYTEPQIPVGGGKNKHKPRYPDRILRIAKFNESIDGNIWFDKYADRVKLYIQSKGHGIRGDYKGWGGGEAIWYYQIEDLKNEAGTRDREEKTRVVEYKIEDIFEKEGLWLHRDKKKVFGQKEGGKWAFIYKDKDNKPKAGDANPPWSWNDHNDTSPIGEIATDPARFIIRYAQGWGPVSTQYNYNPYLDIS